jgi:ribulose-5-phosphate 4-epimerase/fuculose-1-phosphate aldolase
MPGEGVIKFAVRHRSASLDRSRYAERLCQLIAWREILALTGLVGQTPRLYEGAAYGNVSMRVGRPSAGRGRRAFLITGTQTSGRADIGLDEFALVERYDLGRNSVLSTGLIRPSSESLTHGAAYDLGPHVRCVLHAHSPVLWKAARALRLPTTEASASYGTPEMAAEVQRLFREGLFAERRILAMGGHEDGILVVGRTAEEAGQTLITWLARAHEAVCSGPSIQRRD